MATPSPYLERLNCYVQQVLTGVIPVSQNVFRAVERHRRDLEDERFYLDVEQLESVLSFIESLPYVRGDKTGENFKLLPWQVFTMGSLVAWKWTKTGHRRFRFGILELARGQGKTTMLSALLAHQMVKGPAGSHCYCFGSAERIALLAFGDTKRIIMRLGEEAGTRIRPRRVIGNQEWVLGYRDIRENETGSFLEALPAREDTLDGLDPTMVICDESSTYRNRSFEKITTSTVKRQDALIVSITTPGDDDTGIYNEHRDVGVATLAQEHEQPDSFYYLAGLDEDDDIEDTDLWIKANPSLGVTCQLDDLKLRYQQAKRSGLPALKAFRRFHLCQWVGGADSWIQIEKWDKLNLGKRPDLKGRRAWAGLDLSKSRDMSSLVTVIEGDDERLWVYGQHWYPTETAEERENSWKIPLTDWGRESYLTLCPGGTIDYDAVELAIRQLNDDYDLQAIWADPMFASGLEQRLERDGIPFGTLKQSIQYLSPGTVKTEELIAEGRLAHDGDPVLRSACQHAKAYRDCNNNARLDKRSSKSLIDPAMALVMAVSAWHTVSPESVYEANDLKTFG